MTAKIPPELLIKIFIDFCAERYPTSEKLKEVIKKIDVKTLAGKIVILSLLRDTVRAVSLSKIYRSVQHRDEVYMAIIEALEDFEDELEEQEEAEKKNSE